MTSKSRLTKYFNPSELPEELSGSLGYNHDIWLNSRLVSISKDLYFSNYTNIFSLLQIIDDFKKKFEQFLKDYHELKDNFANLKQLRGYETEQDLKQFYQTYSNMQIRLECIIEIGKFIEFLGI